MLEPLRDPVTGTEIIRLTAEKSAQHAIPGPVAAVTPDGRWLVFVTRETGSPNLAAMDLVSGDVRILTLRRDLNAASAAVTRDGLAVLFSARDAVWAVTLDDGTETQLAPFSGARVRHIAVAPDGRAAAAVVAEGPWFRIVEIDVYDGRVRNLVETPHPVGRLQYCPDGRRLLFSGNGPRALCVVDRDGGEPRPVVVRAEGEWLLSGGWLGADSVYFVKFHDGLYVAEVPSSGAGAGVSGSAETPGPVPGQCIFKGPIWHVAASPDGRLVACDTHAPDIGLLLVSPGTGNWKALCHPRSSNRGSQWFEPLPAADEDPESAEFPPPGGTQGPAETRYGPAWTHPNPSFHPDGGSVFYSSDSSGTAQVHRALVPEGWVRELAG